MFRQAFATAFVLCGLFVPWPGEAQVGMRPTPDAGEAIIYRDRNFSGPAVSVSRARPNLGLTWPVRSIRVRGGTWEACERQNYRGRCVRFSQSDNNIRPSALRIRSIRPVGDRPGPGPGPDLSGWTLIGEREVNDFTDRDTISIRVRRLFTAIRLCVYRSRIRVYDLHVSFADGRSESLPVRDYVENGQCTRNLQLAAGRRQITSVQVTYEAASLGIRSATVRLYGR